MTKGKFPNGLSQLLTGSRGEQSNIARHLGVTRQDIGRWKNEERKIPLEHIEKLAEYFGVTKSDVLFEDGDTIISVPIISWVSASGLAEVRTVTDINDSPRIAASGLAPGEWVALTVDGDSMDRISPPDSLILVNLQERALVPNACYIIADEDGNATYKRYRSDPQRFEPVSVNPDHEPLFMRPGQEPLVIGRVRRSVLEM